MIVEFIDYGRGPSFEEVMEGLSALEGDVPLYFRKVDDDSTFLISDTPITDQVVFDHNNSNT